MKKPLKGDRADLRTEIKWIRSVVFWFAFLNSAFSQVPVNGFCQLNTFPVFPGFNRMTIADVNFDSYNDFILFSPAQRNICVISGKQDEKFTDYKILTTPYSYSKIVPFFNREAGSEQLFFSSRKGRVVGLFDFSSFGRFNLIAKIGFDSFPENISITDVDNDGDSDCLVSGSGFSGLSIISYREGELLESKIEMEASFSDAVFADVSNDGFPDIIAFNLLNSSMDIYFNDGTGMFEHIRSINIKGKIGSLRATDLNRDFYVDLIFSAHNSINVIFGDFQSAYDVTSEISTQYFPHQFSISDFNKDRYLDFAYTDTTNGMLSVIFGKGNNEFYSEIFYLMDKELTALQPFTDGATSRLFMLNKKGKINVISRISTLPEEVTVVPAIQPSALASFDYGNNGVSDICYIDKFTHTITFLINDWRGIPATYYSVPVSDDHKEIFPVRIERFKKEFYCYSPNGKMLEIIDFDFKRNKYDSDQLYLPGIAKDLIIKKSKESDHIVIAYEKNNILRVGEYEHRDFRYNFLEYPKIDSNVISPKLSYSNVPQIYFWKVASDSVTLTKATLNSKLIEYEQLGSINSYPEQKTGNLYQYLFYLKPGPISVSLLNSKDDFWSVVSSGSFFNISNSISKGNYFNVSKENILSFEGMYEESSYRGILYLSEDHSFNRIELKEEGKELSFTRLFETDEATDFIVKKILPNKNYLIYTNQSKGYISLYRLN